MIAICIGLSIITIICVALLLTLHEDIRKLNEQIDYKNESGSHFEVFTQSDIPSIKELQKKINNLYQDNSKIEEKALDGFTETEGELLCELLSKMCKNMKIHSSKEDEK